MKTQTDTNAKIVIVPTVALANLVYRAVRRNKTRYNYVVGWYDASGGIGLSLAIADWVKPNQPYVNPHTQR